MVDTPGQFSVKIFGKENGIVVKTLEKFHRSRERGWVWSYVYAE